MPDLPAGEANREWPAPCAGTDPFHVVMLFKRRKDNPEQEKGTICIFQDLARRSQIVARLGVYEALADSLNARAYVSVNSRDIANARRRLMHRLIDGLADPNASLLSQTIGALMESPTRAGQKFIVDIDTKAPDVLAKVRQQLLGEVNSTQLIPTRNGFHLIIPACCIPPLLSRLPDVEIHKDGMTVLSWIGIVPADASAGSQPASPEEK